MNTHLLLVSLTTGMLFFAVYCVGACGKSTPAAGVANAQQVANPRPPEVVGNAPDICPQCGLKLGATTLANKPGK